MEKSKSNKRTGVLIIILIGLLVLAYKVMFMPPSTDVMEDNMAAGERIKSILMQVQSINFDTDIFTDPKFNSLKSIEIPLMILPVGRQNPFSTIFGSN